MDEPLVLPEQMRQYAPYPVELHQMIKSMRSAVFPQWRFDIKDIVRDPAETHAGEAGGLTFIVTAYTQDAYGPLLRGVYHYFPVPAATYDRQSWQVWIAEQIDKILGHETSEALIFTDRGEDERPFAPNHGPGRDPYHRFVYSTDEHRRTSFKGEVKPE